MFYSCGRNVFIYIQGVVVGVGGVHHVKLSTITTAQYDLRSGEYSNSLAGRYVLFPSSDSTLHTISCCYLVVLIFSVSLRRAMELGGETL